MTNNFFASLDQEQAELQFGGGVQLTGEGAAAVLSAPSERLLDIMRNCRDGGFGADYLADVTAVDRGEAGFEVIYQLFSIKRQVKGTVKTQTSRSNPQVPSITSVWPGTDWMEREVYDLMGVEFSGHPCLKRILLNDEFVGHPLRKDFTMQPPE